MIAVMYLPVVIQSFAPSLLQQQQQQHSTRLRSSTTITAPTTLSRPLPERVRITKRESSSLVSSLFEDALNHEILTLEEELELGRAVQEAQALFAALENASDDKKKKKGEKKKKDDQRVLLQYTTLFQIPRGLSDKDLRPHGGRTVVQEILRAGAAARERLVSCNLKLVVSIASHWERRAAASPDLLPTLAEATQEGMLGLLAAVQRYDPSRGLRFSTYATYWITNSVRRCFQTTAMGVLRVPSAYFDFRARFQKLIKEEYYDRDVPVPTLDVIAKQLGVTEKRLSRMLRMTQSVFSLDSPLQQTGRAGQAGSVESENGVLADTLIDNGGIGDFTDSERIDHSLLRQSLENAMASELAPHERDVLRLRLGLDDGVARTCRQVAHELQSKLTTAQVRLTEKRALGKLRAPQTVATHHLLAHLDFAGVDRANIILR